MNKKNRLVEILTGGLTKISQWRVLQSISAGFLNGMGVLFIGVIFSVLSNIIMVITMGNATGLMATVDVMKNVTFGMMGLFFSFTIAGSNAKLNRVNPEAAGFISMALYLLLMKPEFTPIDMVTSKFSVNFSRFGSSGLFASIISGLVSGEVLSLMTKLGLTFKLKGVPKSLQNMFEYIIPGTIIVLLGWVFSYVLGLDLHTLLSRVLKPLVNMSESFTGFVLLSMFTALIFSLGIHPMAAISLFIPIWFSGLAANTELASTGLAPTMENGFQINTFGTFFFFVMLGGSGATLGLNLLMLRSKSKTLKTLGKSAIIPSLMTINEPIIFGMPVVLNPILMVPFILIPAINASIVYFTMSTSLVALPHTMMAIPVIPIGLINFLLTNDFKAVILVFLTLALDVLMWYPFYRVYSRKMEKEESSVQL